MLLTLLPTWAMAAPTGETTQNTAVETTAMDNDELFYQYMLKLAREQQEAVADAQAAADGGFVMRVKALFAARQTTALAGNALTGNDKIIYDYLADKIKEIAAGTETSSEIKMPLSQLYTSNGGTLAPGRAGEVNDATDGKVDVTYWTATDDLGLTNSATEDQVQAAFEAKISYNAEKIHDALLADFPYEMYWYDKTAGWTYGSNWSYYRAPISGKMSYAARGDLTIGFTLYVSPDYTGNTRYKNTSTVNRTYNHDIAAAVDTANAIVTANASKSNYEKLKAYKDAICSNVAYNNAAAASGYVSSYGYGDPWQLVYVFDGDNSTNVVCEGYSKAFQFLCDLSSFSGNLVSYIVTGNMTGGNGGGTGDSNHMWNVVRMEDGKYYLVDVTNCDEGTAGNPDMLFLKGYANKVGNQYQYTSHSAGGYTNYTFDNDTIVLWGSTVLTLSATDYTPYTVTVNAAPNGSVSASPMNAAPGATITLEITPSSGYELDELTTSPVVSLMGNGSTRTFEMPESNVTITPTFKEMSKTLTGLAVTTQPRNKNYTHGDEFDTTGMVVKATYSDASTDNAFTAYDVVYASGGTYLEAGDTKITLSAEGQNVDVTGLSVGKKQLEITGLTAINREYDGTTEVELTGGALSGVIGSETVTATIPTVGTLTNANVGSNKPVSFDTIVFDGADKENYTLLQPTVTVNITPKNISSVTIAPIAAQPYTGNQIKPTVTVADGGNMLVEGTDYTVAYTNNTEVGTANVTITGKGNYTGNTSTTFQITAISAGEAVAPILSATDTTVTVTNAYYAQRYMCLPSTDPAPTTASSGWTWVEAFNSLTPNTMYTVYTYLPGGVGGTDSAVVSASIKTLAADLAVTLSVSEVTYNGTEWKPAVTVKNDNNEIVSSEKYEVTYTNNINAGAALVTVTGKDEYAGSTATAGFTINRATPNIAVSPATITLYLIDGEDPVPQHIDVTVTGVNGETLDDTYVFFSEEDPTIIDASANARTVTARTLGKTTLTVVYGLTDNYNSVETTVPVTVTDKQDAGATLKFNDNATTATVTFGNTAPTLAAPTASSDATNDTNGGWTYSSSNAEVATVNATTGAIKIVGAGEAAISATFDSTHYHGTATVTLTVNKAASSVTTPPTAIETLTYAAAAQELVTAGTANGGTMQYSLDGENYSDTIPTSVDAGDYTVWYKVAGDKDHEDTTPASVEVNIAKATAPVLTVNHYAKYGLTVEVSLDSYLTAYGGTVNTVDVENTNGVIENGEVKHSSDSLTFKLADTEAIIEKTAVITVNVTSAQNYEDYAIKVNVTALDKTVPTLTVADFTKLYDGKAVTVADIIKTATAKDIQNNDYNVAGTWSFKDGAAPTTVADTKDYTLVFTPEDTSFFKKAEKNVAITINRATITVTAVDKSIYTGSTVPSLADPKLGTDYTIKGLADGEQLDGTLTLAYQDNGENAVEPDNKKTGTYKIVPSGLTIPDGIAANYEDSIVFVPGTLTISQYVAPYIPYTPSSTETTKTNTDGSTTTTTKSSDGTVTETTKNTDGSTETVVTKPDGSTTTTVKEADGSSTETVKNADGSSKVTEKSADGSESVIETAKDGSTKETVKNADGSESVKETAADGSATETNKDADGTVATTKTDANGNMTEATAEVSSKSASEAIASAEPITLPAKYSAASSAANACMLKIDMPASVTAENPVKVEIPVENADNGTVVVLVKADGTEEIVKDCTVSEDGVVLSVDGDVTVKVIDNTKSFVDAIPSWAQNEVQFVTSREIFNGTDKGEFNANDPMSRGMIAQVLFNLDKDSAVTDGKSFADTIGAWYDDAANWAASIGVVMGDENGSFNGDADLSRQDLATMLYRYAQAKGYVTTKTTSLAGFADATDVADYAEVAMGWAVANGIITGSDKGLEPTESATRAQVAAMISRFITNVVA